MYICSCHAVTDGAIRKHIQSGTRTFAQLAKLTRVATQCGICGRGAKELFYKILEEETGIGKPNSSVEFSASAAAAAVESPSCAATPCGRAGGCKDCPAFHNHEKPK